MKITPEQAGIWVTSGIKGTSSAVAHAEKYGFQLLAGDRLALERFENLTLHGVRDDELGELDELVGLIDYITGRATDHLQLHAPAGYAFTWEHGALLLQINCHVRASDAWAVHVTGGPCPCGSPRDSRG